MTFTRDPGMDRNPDPWTSPEIDPDFRDAAVTESSPENVDNPYGAVHFAEAGEMHAESIGVIRETNAAIARLVKALSDYGKDIMRIDAGVTKSRSARLRVRWLIVSRATVGDATLTIGTASYVWTVGAVPVRIDFPLVIENGTDIAYAGDGRIYLVSDPE